MASSREHSREDDVGDLESYFSELWIAGKYHSQILQHDITSQEKRNHSSDERHIGSKSASRYFSLASFHDTPCTSIHPRIQSSHPTKHVNSDWVRV